MPRNIPKGFREIKGPRQNEKQLKILTEMSAKGGSKLQVSLTN